MTIYDFATDDLTLQIPVKIRVATADDVHKLEWNGQFIHYRNLFRRAYREQRLGNRLLLVADFNDYPIARMFLQFASKNLSIADGIERGYIYSFTVMEPFRNLGIGSRMLTIGEELLQSKNFHTVTISVSKDNTRALKLYKKNGYQIYAEDSGDWQYVDHKGILRDVHEPSWLLKKSLPHTM